MFREVANSAAVADLVFSAEGHTSSSPALFTVVGVAGRIAVAVAVTVAIDISIHISVCVSISCWANTCITTRYVARIALTARTASVRYAGTKIAARDIRAGIDRMRGSAVKE